MELSFQLGLTPVTLVIECPLQAVKTRDGGHSSGLQLNATLPAGGLRVLLEVF